MDIQKILQEIKYRTSRSSGAGGQHVNKVETKVDLLFDLPGSNALTPEEKQRIIDRLANRITKEGVLIISCQESRSQLNNKETATRDFLQLLQKAVQPPKKRKKVKPLTADRKSRLKAKKIQSEKKEARKKINFNFH